MKISIRFLSLTACLLIGVGFMFGFYFGSKKNRFGETFDFSADVEADPDVDWSKGITDETTVKFNIFSEGENKNKVIHASFLWNPVLRDTKYLIYKRGVISEIHSSSSTKD